MPSSAGAPGPAGPVTLRPYGPAHRGIPLRVDSPFDDFGPAGAAFPDRLPGSSFDGPGGLVVYEGDAVVGTVSWVYRQWGPTAGSQCIMIGIGLRPEAHGRGIGAAAQRQLADLVFRHTRLHRVEAATERENVAEQRALEKAGFTREGVVRESLWRLGAFHDCVLFSRLRTDADLDGPAPGSFASPR